MHFISTVKVSLCLNNIIEVNLEIYSDLSSFETIIDKSIFHHVFEELSKSPSLIRIFIRRIKTSSAKTIMPLLNDKYTMNIYVTSMKPNRQCKAIYNNAVSCTPTMHLLIWSSRFSADETLTFKPLTSLYESIEVCIG